VAEGGRWRVCSSDYRDGGNVCVPLLWAPTAFEEALIDSVVVGRREVAHQRVDPLAGGVKAPEGQDGGQER